jgi:hypothetical protein
MAVTACSAAPVSPLPARPAPPFARPAPDAAPEFATEVPRGGRCAGTVATCAAELTCLALPRGTCGSPCDGGGACDGACVESARDGAWCLAPCTHDDDCRVEDGYTCDPSWHACTIPNWSALVPKACPAVVPAHDPAFGDSEPWAIGAEPSAIAMPPVRGQAGRATGFVALVQTRTGIDAIGRASAEHAATIAETIATGARDPRLARSGHGNLFAVWADDHAVRLATSSDGATWSSPVEVQAKGDAPGTPLVAIGPDPKRRGGERIYVAYGAPAQGLRVRASDNGGVAFGPPVTAAAGAIGNLAVGGDGRLHVVTLRGDVHGGYGSAQQQIEYTVSRDGGASFAPPAVVSVRDEVLPFYFANPSIAVDDRRKRIYIAYVRGGRDGIWDVVVAATKDAGKTWTRTAIGDGCSIHFVPNLALDPTTGVVHVAWYDTAGAPGRFVHATCASGAATCKVRGAIDSVPFASLSLAASRGARWLGDHESLVVDDADRVLHALWAEPVLEDGRAVTRVFHATAKLPAR